MAKEVEHGWRALVKWPGERPFLWPFLQAHDTRKGLIGDWGWQDMPGYCWHQLRRKGILRAVKVKVTTEWEE